MRLKGRTALVTGSSRGIGRGIALRLAREGADVVVNYLADRADAEAAAAEHRTYGVRSVALQGDVSSVASVRQLVQQAVDAMGTIDVLVNNAGVQVNAPFWDVTEEDYGRVVDVNLKGAFFAAQALVRHLRATGRPGRVINIGSVHEEIPFPNFAAYCASKGGLRMLTRNLAVELGPLGITVNSVAPGAIETPINSALLNDPAKLRPLLGQIPAGRLGTPEDVAGVVAFLASDDAVYVTGASYFVDGGLAWFYQEQ